MEVEINRVEDTGINSSLTLVNISKDYSVKSETGTSEHGSTNSKNYSTLTPQKSDSNLKIQTSEAGFTRKRKTIHATFLLLKKKLNLENFMRKTQIDSLLKKCKSKAFRTIHEALKKCLKVKLPRLPQPFITNIKIDFNKVHLEKSIYEIYREYKIIPSVEEFIEKKYLYEDKINLFKDFLNLTFRDVFEYYINSKQYVKDYNHIVEREGEPFAILFNYISKIFVQYYLKSKGNKHKKNREVMKDTCLIQRIKLAKNLHNRKRVKVIELCPEMETKELIFDIKKVYLSRIED